MSNFNASNKNKVLMTLTDKDVFPDTPHATDITWKDRPTGKVVLLNEEGEIALIGNKVHNYFMLPGGGIEENEDLLTGTMRECKEETGCEIEIIKELGFTEDYRERDSKHCISYGYIARVVSCGDPRLTENEIDVGVYVKWLPLLEARDLFLTQEEQAKQGGVKFYNTCFNIFRDSLFIRLAERSICV